MTTEPGVRRTCPHCGTPVAQRAETCLMCGAHLREQRRRRLRLPHRDLVWVAVLALAAVAAWVWKPWQLREPLAAVLPSPTSTATVTPTPTYEIAPTATPLQSPTPTVTPTPLPNQTVHTVKPGETVITIAKLYGTTKAEVLKANGLKENSTIRPGDQLIIPLLEANTPTPTLTPIPSPTPMMYVVQSGDTLSEIAKRFGTTVEALMRDNGLTGATGLRPGTRLSIYAPSSVATAMPFQTYEVKAGDTLSTIAARYKVTVAQIREFNGLTSDILKVGQKLQIPAPGATFVPTATPTATPLPTETITPTPTPPYPAPHLLSPRDGSVFSGADAVILLNWASVGLLGPDEWYAVRMRREGPVTEQVPLGWTKSTSWRVPADLYVAGLAEPQAFFWQVVVMVKTGEDGEGRWTGAEIGPRSEMRTFGWK